MIMESGLHDLHGMIDALRYDEFFSDQGVVGALGPEETQHFPLHHNCARFLQPSPEIISGGSAAASSVSGRADGDSPEDSEIFSDIALSYIRRMLMEEDIDEKVNTYQKEAALRAAEKPFYDILGQKYPPSPDRPAMDVHRSLGSHADCGTFRNPSSCCSGVVDCVSVSDLSDQHRSLVCATPNSDYPSPSSFSSCSSVTNVVEPFEDSLANAARPPSLFFEGFPAWHFERGVEEARKFLPSNGKLVIDLEANGEGTAIKSFGADVEEKDVSSRVRKNPNNEELDLVEGRSNKQSAVSTELEGMRCEMLDMVLLYQGDTRWKRMYDLHESMKNEASKTNPRNEQATKGPNAIKPRGKRPTKKDVVDLRTILIHCAQAVAVDDRRTANELLKQIRQHTSSSGDGPQRLAHWFADGLEARLAGTGTQIYKTLVAKRTTASDILKAYHLYLAACPFKKISHFFSNQTILNVSAKASRVHIIDFGIYFGFQWPYLIQRLSRREGGPPKLRITGIDVPQPGFRPTERIEETGRRLEDYAKSFHVPFEYQAIASKWETIRAEDLNIREGEVVIVNCLYRFRNLVDETVIVDSPRNKVLNTIRKMNPDVFVHGIVNGSYGAPFFVTRFREALFHYSALFDMLEETVPRENEQRLLIERDLFGREALNVIACEGSERVERPETYKQWQVRNLKAGFSQLPLDAGIMKKAKEKVRASYHKDFVIDVDGRWLLQGWKGRIVYAISTWKPNNS